MYLIDIGDEKLIKIFEEFKPKVIIHNAALISVPKFLANPIEDAGTNILGNINILESVRKAGVEKIEMKLI